MTQNIKKIIILPALVLALFTLGLVSAVPAKAQTAPAQVLNSMTLTPAALTLNVGASQQLVATPMDQSGAGFPNAMMNFTSNNPSVATVSQTGIVTGVFPGTATITGVASVGGLTYQATVTVTVVDATGITNANTGVLNNNGVGLGAAAGLGLGLGLNNGLYGNGIYNGVYGNGLYGAGYTGLYNGLYNGIGAYPSYYSPYGYGLGTGTVIIGGGWNNGFGFNNGFNRGGFNRGGFDRDDHRGNKGNWNNGNNGNWQHGGNGNWNRGSSVGGTLGGSVGNFSHGGMTGGHGGGRR